MNKTADLGNAVTPAADRAKIVPKVFISRQASLDANLWDVMRRILNPEKNPQYSAFFRVDLCSEWLYG
jgi:hypothetical protein